MVFILVRVLQINRISRIYLSIYAYINNIHFMKVTYIDMDIYSYIHMYTHVHRYSFKSWVVLLVGANKSAVVV